MAELFIICGHGAGDPGATGHGYNEAERVRTLAKYLKKHGGDSVTIGDTSKNWYRHDIIDTYKFKPGIQIIELHMDSGGGRGGHVIIDDEAGNPDKYDLALVDFLAKVFPGRSNKIVWRNDLENPDDAVRRHLNYRLLEVCFIDSLEDLKVFNGSLDYIAKEILKCFGIGSGAVATPKPEPVQETLTPAPKKKTTSQIADEVIAGKWGNGATRKNKLEAAGYSYSAVQAEVNRKLGLTSGNASSTPDIDKLAREVIAGKYGNGAARKKALGALYEQVQRRVNEILG